jgi:hypothetical protein
MFVASYEARYEVHHVVMHMRCLGDALPGGF